MPAPPPSRHVLFVVAATACWGCGTVLSKQVLDRGVAPLSLLAIELAASCVILTVVHRAAGPGRTKSPALGRLAALGILNPGLAYALGLLGLLSVTASMSVLLWATEPLLILALARIVLRERIGLLTSAAIGTAMVGVVLVVRSPGAAGSARGIALSLAAVACCGLYAVLTRRWLLDDSSVTVVLSQQVAALGCAVMVTALAVATGRVDLGLPHDATTWALGCLSGTVYYGFAFWFFVGGLHGLAASTAGALLPLVPVFGLAASHAVGERLAADQWVGAAIVVAASIAVAARPAPRRSPGPSAERGRS